MHLNTYMVGIVGIFILDKAGLLLYLLSYSCVRVRGAAYNDEVVLEVNGVQVSIYSTSGGWHYAEQCLYLCLSD